MNKDQQRKFKELFKCKKLMLIIYRKGSIKVAIIAVVYKGNH